MQLELHNLYRSVAASLVLGWFLAFGFLVYNDFNHFAPASKSTVALIQVNPDRRVADSEAATFSSIAELFLMGKPVKTPNPVAIESKPIPETRLNLSLRGVFASHGGQLSGAVIETGDKQPGFYQIGDVIRDDITLAAVEDQAVIIDRGGKTEKLSFDKALTAIDSFSREKNTAFVKHQNAARAATAMALLSRETETAGNHSLEDRLLTLRKKLQHNN